MKRNKKQNIKLFALILILFLGIGYAALTTTLKINGTVDVSKASWDVHFENVNITDGSVTANPAPTTDGETTTEMTYTINFTKPGDFFEFTTDIANDGTIDAMIDVISNKVYSSNGQTEIQLPGYLTSSTTYDDGVSIRQNQIIEHGTSEKIKVRVEFKKDIQVSDLPSSGDTTIVFKLRGEYKQSDENAKPIRNTCNDNENITILSQTKCTANENVNTLDKICKRAVNLHQEKCTQTDETYYCSGAGYSQGSMITYGNCGTQGSAPVSGDAFTCDVNGDGDFDELTERFYYVSDYYDTTNKNFDNTVAVLIYYNNFSQGISCNARTFAYDSSNQNWHGPATLKLQLPTVVQWKNVSLNNTLRAILSEYKSTHDSSSTSGGTLPSSFSYSGYAARILTVKELMTGCNITEVGYYPVGEIDSCNYLMENTLYANSLIGTYGSWLETPRTVTLQNVWLYGGDTRRVGDNLANYANSYGGRPVIEVPKTKISY